MLWALAEFIVGNCGYSVYATEIHNAPSVEGIREFNVAIYHAITQTFLNPHGSNRLSWTVEETNLSGEHIETSFDEWEYSRWSRRLGRCEINVLGERVVIGVFCIQGTHANVGCWGLSRVLYKDFNGIRGDEAGPPLLVDDLAAYNFDMIHAKVGAQLPAFGVASYIPLPSRSAESEGGKGYRDFFYPRMLSMVGVGLVVAGIWTGMGGDGNSLPRWLAALSMLSTGFAIQVMYPFPLYFLNAENAPVFSRAFCASAYCYGRTENVGVLPVVVAPLEFRDVERQIFGADMVEATHNAALQQRPEAIDCLGMDQSAHIFTAPVADGLMRELWRETDVAAMFVSGDKADFLRHGHPDEMAHGPHVRFAQHASHDVALPLNGTDDDFLAAAASAGSLFIPMSVLVLAADIGFINLDDTHQLAKLGVDQSRANAVAHVVCGRVGAEAHHAMDLQRGNTLLAGQHEVDHTEPLAHPDIGILENCPDQYGEAITSDLGALSALPVKRTISDGRDFLIPAAWATNTIRPAASNQICLAGIVGREQFVELPNCHLLGEPNLTHQRRLHA